uniref:Uncharacterized protein n=1 Tax=Amphilophus citrinellus TaxID=61819 RepID=A0A3Q0R9E6_AMPCI
IWGNRRKRELAQFHNLESYHWRINLGEKLTLLKHDMALDYILAKQGGLCVTLNLTGDACYTLIQTTDMDEEEDVVIGGVVERYPF